MSINDHYTISYATDSEVTVQISSYVLSLFPSYRNPDVFYMGPTDQNLTTLNWMVCTSPANSTTPATMQGLLTAIKYLNTGKVTYGSLALVVSDSAPKSDRNLSVGGNTIIDGSTTLGGTVTANADATFNYPVTLEDTFTVGGQWIMYL